MDENEIFSNDRLNMPVVQSLLKYLNRILSPSRHEVGLCANYFDTTHSD